MMTVWKSAAKEIDTEIITTIAGNPSIRERKGVYGDLITIIFENLTIDTVQTKFIQIKRTGLLQQCRSLKLFFKGQVPDLSHRNMKQKGPIWYLEEESVSICAVPFGPNEWCFMIEKRSGHGIPVHALSFIPLMEHQLKLEVDVG